MKHVRSVGIVIFLAILLGGSLGSSSVSGAALDDGVSWLIGDQDAQTGFWGMGKETRFRDTAVVLDVLGQLGADSTVLQFAWEALDDQMVSSTDYLSRKAIARSRLGGIPVTTIEQLEDAQDADGGWGYQRDYESNTFDTALAVRALGRAAFLDLSKLGATVTYLASAQGIDGGWSFLAADTSSVFFTSHTVLALSQIAGDFDVASQIEGAVAWLKGQVHPDDGFGTGDMSNPFETGLAIAALTRADPLAPEITGAIGYLETTQLPDGSWNSDAYSTAMAVFGMAYIAPDLAIGTSDISLSNSTPSDSELVTISVTIHNRGVLDAESVLVQLMDRSSLANDSLSTIHNEQLGTDVIIAHLPAGQDTTIDVVWDTYEKGGNHQIRAQADPFDEIAEPEERNNIASKDVHVYYPADLIIASIEFDPEYPDSSDTVIIKTTVRNIGETTAQSISLQVYLGDPDQGGFPLLNPPYVIAQITPGGQFTLNLDMGNFFDTDGEYLICACADIEDAIREIDETNNCGCETLWVGYRCEAVALSMHLNLLGLPLEPVAALSSHQLITQIPSCVELDGWSRLLQKWTSTIDTGERDVVGEDFSVETRDGFFARVTQTGEALLCGEPVTEHEATSLESGFNLVSVPNEDACYTAYTLIDDIETCGEARSWNSADQSWETAEKIGEDQFTGEDFDVVRGGGYFVRLQDSGNWTSRTCDTLLVLPDLLVTPDDILLDPNPVQAGADVGIFVNIQNIGYETAYSPRLDIYIGDPDAGGTHILGGNLPVDIPPGGESGYYGNYFIFDNPGNYDIYGVADYYDSIQELDETNNRAYRTLQVVPAVFATNLGGGESVAGVSQGPALSLEAVKSPVRLPAHTETDPGASLPDRAFTPTAATPISSNPRGPKDAGPGYFAEQANAATEMAITAIDGVAAGDHASSSTVITWVTDGLADGCVNFGPTVALGYSECEAGPDREVHKVVLAGLTDETLYYFEVVSDGITDDNGGSYYTFTTTQQGAGLPYVAYGRVVEAGVDSASAEGVLVTGTLHRGGLGSYPLVARTDVDGMWLLNLGNLKDPVTNDVLSWDVADTLHLELEGGSLGAQSDTVVISGGSPQDCGVIQMGPAAAVEESTDLIPTRYYLSANYPNPFSLNTTIRFGLPAPEHVELSVYSIQGRKVVTLVNDRFEAGHYVVAWNGRTAAGHPASSGTYFYRLESGTYQKAGKMFHLR